MNHIELFAGCGGLSLGLEKQGFKLLLANELSPMAAETFAFNILKVNLQKEALSKKDKIYWLRSEFGRGQPGKRLRENPNAAINIKDPICDLDDISNHKKQLRRSLIIGSIRDLNLHIKNDPGLASALSDGLGDGGVDLVSGGPPCQSFSMAGLRQHENVRNQLPQEFAQFVGHIRPKMVLLENVTGILRAFNIDGERHFAWFEVAKAFALEGYMPICLHVNAKYVGAAQNRPRFILLALERSLAKKMMKVIEKAVGAGDEIQPVKDLFDESSNFLSKIDAGKEPVMGDLVVREVEDHFRSPYDSIYNSKLFHDLVMNPLVKKSKGEGEELVSVRSAIDDLRTDSIEPSEYVDFINRKAFGKREIENIENHEHRQHGRNGKQSTVRARFRLYQIISKFDKREEREVSKYLRTLDRKDLGDETIEKMLGLNYLLPDGTREILNDSDDLVAYLDKLHTKKQTQKALLPDRPAPAAMSIPDDACHYHGQIQRTLTVREMARIQSFPDWFVFRSKVTTGGQMRKFEVPQYTQVGNAVPPLLGLALGKVCKKLLELADFKP